MSALHSLAMHCRDRYVRAADLLGIEDPVVRAVRRCGWGRAEYPDGVNAWSNWFYRELIPVLLCTDEFVRNILRCLGALPCDDPSKAADAIKHLLANMVLHKAWSFPISAELIDL